MSPTILEVRADDAAALTRCIGGSLCEGLPGHFFSPA